MQTTAKTGEINPKYERFLKKKEAKENTEPKPKGQGQSAHTQQETLSLALEFEDRGSQEWLEQNNPAARATFNVINRTKHPERAHAAGLAIVPAKGTSFEDKRENAVTEAKNVRAGEWDGEVELIPEENNPYDPNAILIRSLASGKPLGYIPKANAINATYKKAMKEGRLTGAWIIHAKTSRRNSVEGALLMIATGWKKAETPQEPPANAAPKSAQD
jgi:hypothetical protein